MFWLVLVHAITFIQIAPSAVSIEQKAARGPEASLSLSPEPPLPHLRENAPWNVALLSEDTGTGHKDFNDIAFK
jgi:hypothetical protein